MSVFNEFGVEPSLFVTSIPTLTQTCPLWQIRAVFGPMWDFRPKGSPFAEIGEIRSKAGRLTQFHKSWPFSQIGLSLEITQGGYFDSNTFYFQAGHVAFKIVGYCSASTFWIPNELLAVIQVKSTIQQVNHFFNSRWVDFWKNHALTCIYVVL